MNTRNLVISISMLALLHYTDALLAQTGPVNTQLEQAPAAAGDLQETIFLHTDKTFYVAGELLWFKLYCLDAAHRLAGVSKIAYVEVLDKANKPQLQAKIGLQEGEGNGSFLLPISLHSGNYTIRAYTNWMKNFGADRFFDKQIQIVNTLKRMDPAAADTPRYQIDFFPEGGSLVAGLQSKLAFKAVDGLLKGVACSGAVVDNGGDTVGRFRSYKFGLGSFAFTPLAGHTYTAFVDIGKDRPLVKALPTALEQGYLIRLQTSGKQLSITVKTNLQTSGGLLLTATNGQKTFAQKTIVAHDSAVFGVNEEELAEGITRFTVFNETGQPVCERLYFKQPQPGMLLTARSDAASYGTRKKVTVSLLTADSAANPVAGYLSMSVCLLDTLQAPDEADIVNWLWLGAELKGRIESPRYYFTHNDREAMENLVLTHGWRKFRNPAAGAAGVSFIYPPEYSGHLITGKVINTATGKPQPDIQTFLSVPGLQTKFYVQKSSDSGQVKFDVKDHYGAGEIVVQTHAQDDNTYRVDIASPFSEEYLHAEPAAPGLTQRVLDGLARRSVGMQVQHAYSEDSLARFQLPQTDTLPFFGQADHEYLLDNYTRFVTMEEVLREYVREINVRNHSGGLEMIMLNEPRREFFNGNMLVLVDGVPVFDQSKIFSFDPLRVKKLDVVSTQYFLGYYAFNGIASFSTYKGELEGFPLDPKALVIDYEGLQLQREFYSPQYPTESERASRTPDFRSVLQWAPAIKTNSTGKKELSFYTSDIKGKYLILVQGISADGKAGSAYSTIGVD